MMKNISRAEFYRDLEFYSGTGETMRKGLTRSQSVHTIRNRENRKNLSANANQANNNTSNSINNNSNNTNNNNTNNDNNNSGSINKSIMKMKDQREDHFEDIRIALAGAKNCGKSALAVRYLTKRFIGEYDSHKDVTLQRSMNVADREVHLYLKDTTGTGWLKSPASLINWTSAIVIVYSITDRQSFVMAKNLLELVHTIKPLNSRCTLLIGNKCDLKHLRQVEKCEAKKLASDFGVQFLECSASENYDEVCSSFTRLIVEAMIVQSAKKHSWDNQDGEECRQEENKIRRRSFSLSQAAFKDNNNNNSSSSKKDDKKDYLKAGGDERIPSPTADLPQPPTHRDTPLPQRKQSLRRKISGIGSKLVGSQNNR